MPALYSLRGRHFDPPHGLSASRAMSRAMTLRMSAVFECRYREVDGVLQADCVLSYAALMPDA